MAAWPHCGGPEFEFAQGRHSADMAHHAFALGVGMIDVWSFSQTWTARLAKDALATISVDDTLVVDEIGGGLADRALRNPGRDSLLLQLGQEALEICAVMATGCARTGGRCGPRWRLEAGGEGLCECRSSEHGKSDRTEQEGRLRK